ncbi:PD-(D/E)XK nuclease superfamily protein [uncultured archaeon]|nr:PD-(D/E)XK nuclease superfamily protein [uncultured archaeon]
MAVYSYSRLETFEQCRLKFKYKYIDKIIPEIPKSIEAHLGGSVHKTLEWLYSQLIEKKIPSIDEVIMHYSEKWAEENMSKMLIVNKFAKEKDYFDKGVKFLIDYYFKHRPFKSNTIAVEKKIEINLDEAGDKKLVGFIDRLVHNVEKNEMEIHDYKTANTFPRKEDLEKNRQLALYSIAIKEEFGREKDISLIWHFLAYNEEVCIKKTDKQLEDLKKEVIELIDKIEATKTFPPNIQKLCDWCEYKNICEGWNSQKKNFS